MTAGPTCSSARTTGPAGTRRWPRTASVPRCGCPGSDEETGPRLVLADPEQSVHLADLTGDGLADLVRVRNGEVCYWPNLGHGRFGAKVAMDGAPHFDRPDRFDQRRVRLADVDGSGRVDIVYLGGDGVTVYFNQSGNSWSAGRPVAAFPAVDDVAAIEVADLMGNGTACLVWSSALPGHATRPMRYVDLMGGQKPHLLVRVVNNLGAETTVHYAPSTRFALADKLAGRPWVTKLPFPVHVVERVETVDRIAGNRFVTRSAYHHGYFDGAEREFRGFGLVEQWDTEEFGTLGEVPDASNLDASSHVPPVLTRTWFHTGAPAGVAGSLDDHYRGEYYQEPEAGGLLLDDTVLPPGLGPDEERESCRALKGAMLRREVYALDGSDRESDPYVVTEQNLAVRMLQPVEDRLFKLRHCMNIEGVVRQLPLFEPPIDPGMLVRARAAGVDLSSALPDRSAPLPHYRFPVMLQKASALTQTVRGLGGALLSVLEKADGEAMATLRADQEVAVLEAVREAKKLAVKESEHGLAAAERSLTVVEQRRDYYLRLVSAGLRPDEELQKKLMDQARNKQKTGSITIGVAAALPNVPTIVTGVSGALSSPVATSTVVAGLALAKAVELGAQGFLIDAANRNTEAAMAGVAGGFGRRTEEWANQLALAERETKQVEKQIEAARVRVALAGRDLDNSERQIENARSVRDFMEQKFTNTELYQWMLGQLSTLYFQSYQLAYDLAKQAERAYRHELALPDATFVQFGYWDSLKKGLLAGERLQYDLDRMDAGYLENNRREYELTRHVSLALLDPVALTQLRTAGSCEFSIPEALYDLDGPGQYLRRIKSVSVTVPCVTGPYTGVPLRLTLVSSRTRVDPSAAGAYPIETSGDDLRFQVETGGVQSIVTSAGRDDTGLFAPSSGDGRYLPFEGSGAISDWNLTLTSAVPTFDWDTITDVVLHVRYTAREGGELLRASALASLQDELRGLPLRRAFSARGEFPSEWNAFLRPAEGSEQAVLSVELAERLFPHLAHQGGLTITGLEVVALVRDPGSWTPAPATVSTSDDVQAVVLTGSAALFGRQPSAAVAYAGAEPGSWEVSVPSDGPGPPAEWADDVILIVTYQLELDMG